jgi:hypothetical protein
MKKRKDTHEQNTGIQFSVSHEMLLFLEWLLQSRDTLLQELVQKAINTGVVDINYHDAQSPSQNIPLETAYITLFEFFTTMEELLQNAIGEEMKKQIHEKISLPIIDQLDASICGRQVIRTSIEMVIKQQSDQPNKTIMQDQLMKEVLKCWDPINDSVVN